MTFVPEVDWEKELFKYVWVTNGQLLCNPEKLADIVERIHNEGRESVLYVRCMKHWGAPQYSKDEHGQECTECAVQEREAAYESLRRSHDALKQSHAELMTMLGDAVELVRFSTSEEYQVAQRQNRFVDSAWVALADARKAQP